MKAKTSHESKRMDRASRYHKQTMLTITNNTSQPEAGFTLKYHEDKRKRSLDSENGNKIAKRDKVLYPNIHLDLKGCSLAAKLNVDINRSPLKSKDIEVCGHRGAVFAEPENTVKSFCAAAAMGCDSVELDVFLLKDGKLVVFHGSGTDKRPGLLHSYCGVEGSILDYDWHGVQNLRLKKECEDFPCSSNKFDDSYIPLLEEVLLTAKKNGFNVRIELKGPGTETPCLELVENMEMVDQCSFASFNHERVAKIRSLRPDRKPDGTHRYKTGCLYSNHVPDNFLEECDKIGASEVHLKYDTCTKERVASIHSKGMRSLAYFRGPKAMKADASTKYLDVGNEDETMYQALINTGVMSMCVNQPNVLANMIASM